MVKKRKVKTQGEKIFTIDINLRSICTDREFERFDAMAYAFGKMLFMKNIGAWGGRETTLKRLNRSKKEYNYTLFYYVLSSTDNYAIEYLYDLIKEFKLKKVIAVKVHEPYIDYEFSKETFEKIKEYYWGITRTNFNSITP